MGKGTRMGCRGVCSAFEGDMLLAGRAGVVAARVRPGVGVMGSPGAPRTEPRCVARDAGRLRSGELLSASSSGEKAAADARLSDDAGDVGALVRGRLQNPPRASASAMETRCPVLSCAAKCVTRTAAARCSGGVRSGSPLACACPSACSRRYPRAHILRVRIWHVLTPVS
jgi:hypothetical protein